MSGSSAWPCAFAVGDRVVVEGLKAKPKYNWQDLQSSAVASTPLATSRSPSRCATAQARSRSRSQTFAADGRSATRLEAASTTRSCVDVFV